MLAGDDEAFSRFFDGHFSGLYRFALSRVDHDHDAAEEIAQRTMCAAVAKLSTYRGEATLFTWLCTFCRHEIAAHYRSRGSPARHVDLVEDSPEIRSALESISARHAEEPESVLDRREIGRLVQVALDRLPGRYGDVLEWKYLEGVPVKEIAARLGSTDKAAESTLTRAREAFRDLFSTLVRGPVRRPSPSEETP